MHKIYIAPFNGTETLNASFDHTNIVTASNGGSKVQHFYTTINNKRTTQTDIYSIYFDEWMLLSKKLKGSCIQSVTDFYSNYFWMEDFTNNASVYEKPLTPPEENMSDGIDIANQEVLYQYFGLQTTNSPYNWYVYAITERILTIGPGIISLT